MNKHFWYVGRSEIILSFLKKYCDVSGKMLEVGCGKGDVLLHLKNKGVNIEGCDISDDALAILSEKTISYKLDVCNMNIDRKFDIVGCFDVLEHIENDELALKNIYTSLKLNGKIILTVPACNLLWSNFDVLGKHFRRYNMSDLKEKIDRSGFRIIRVSYFMFFLFPIIFAMRFLGQNATSEDDFIELNVVPVVNDVFLFIIKVEKFLMRFWNLPYGSSIIMVAEKI